MTTMSKDFAYDFNTPSEDTKVTKVLSERRANDEVKLASFMCWTLKRSNE